LAKSSFVIIKGCDCSTTARHNLILEQQTNFHIESKLMVKTQTFLVQKLVQQEHEVYAYFHSFLRNIQAGIPLLKEKNSTDCS